MADIVPQGDCGTIADIVDHTDRGSIQPELATEYTRLTNRSGGEDPQQMPMGKDQSDRCRAGVHIGEERIATGLDIGNGLAARTTIPHRPAGRPLADLCRRETLVVAVVELA